MFRNTNIFLKLRKILRIIGGEELHTTHTLSPISDPLPINVGERGPYFYFKGKFYQLNDESYYIGPLLDGGLQQFKKDWQGFASLNHVYINCAGFIDPHHGTTYKEKGLLFRYIDDDNIECCHIDSIRQWTYRGRP